MEPSSPKNALKNFFYTLLFHNLDKTPLGETGCLNNLLKHPVF